ncbi:unnamed protein product [Rhizophagus irregularis]|nr:unnamed protein product [Rhizophagus irregularis]
MNSDSFENFIQYNTAENSVSVPFGRVAEYYLKNHPLLKNIRLKSQSRKKTPELIKEELILVERVEGAVDFIEWRTKTGQTKSTNRIDDIIKLTEKGEELVRQIEAGVKKDKLCWQWVMYCAGDGNSCQRECGEIGKCMEGCQNEMLPNNLKNGNDMHLCKLRIVSEVYLSQINNSNPLKIKVLNSHLSSNILMTHTPQIDRLSLTRQVRDNIIINRRADHKTTKNIKAKMLAPYNGANEEVLREALHNQKEICDDKKLYRFLIRDDRRTKESTGPWTILHYLINEILKPKGYILYYQQPDLSAETSSEHFYQLTLSDQLWLKNAQRYGRHCIGVDSKYDLNNDRAPVLAIVAENSAGFGTPLAFGLSNKENNWTTSIALMSLKNNVPCNNPDCEHKWYYEDLPNGKGFQRITECAKNHSWIPLVMMDKHRPTKIATEKVLDRTILCWFHVMQTFGENLNNWNISWPLRYPIALAFKIIGRSRSVDLAKELGLLYVNFINSLDLKQDLKNKLIKDLNNNWICDEWILSFIDAGRILESTTHIMTTNNYTERLNRTIESQYSGTKTVVNFVERLYGIRLFRENLTNECGQSNFEAGLATVFDMQTIEQETQAAHLASDKLRRLNHGKLLFLLGYVEFAGVDNYFYLKKGNYPFTIETSYNDELINLDRNGLNLLMPLHNKLMEQHLSKVPNHHDHSEYYLINIKTGECTCFDYIWNGPFRDTCKHCHAALIYQEAIKSSDMLLFKQEIKKELVQYFKNKQRVLPVESKNISIYNEDIETAYLEIVNLYNTNGLAIFKSYSRPNENNNDPFRPVELNNYKSNNGAPPKSSAKPRKPSRILKDTDRNTPFSEQTRSTKRIRKNIRNAKENIKGIENPYEPLITSPFQNAQPTIMQSYSQNNYIHSLLPISQSIQTPIDSSYVYPTNLPISFPSTTPYYSNSSVQLNNCPPTQNSYSFTP